jgi:hypothetical protein
LRTAFLIRHGAPKKPNILEELDPDVVVCKKESQEKFVRKTVGAKRRAPISGGWKERHAS